MPKSTLAPVILFVYARPKHTALTINALKINNLANHTDLIIYSDAAKSPYDQENVNQVRRQIRAINGFNSVTIIERKKNYGLAKNIIDGVTEVCEEYERAIVLEDDIVTSPAFLQYMNSALEKYKDERKVWHISGWNYPIAEKKIPDTFLWREMNCWGWGTWKNRWQHFKKDPFALVQSFSKKDIKKFNLDGHHTFWNQVLDNLNNTRDTWAIFWYATIFSNNGLCLNPKTSLASNIGFDSTGENCGENNYFAGPINTEAPKEFPDIMEENPQALKSIKKFYRALKFKRISNDISRIISPPKTEERAKLISPKLKLLIKALKRKTLLGLKYTPQSECIILNKEPINSDFGFNTGTPIDRFYIDDFLTKNSEKIAGNILEISENTYTKKYARLILSSEILTYSPSNSPNIIIGDLTKKETLPKEKYDCFICTQTLNFIFEIESAISGIHHLLKENGTAIITVAGLTQISKHDMERWGDYWRLTTKSAENLFSKVFGIGNIEVGFYGNSLAACFLMQGIPSEELEAADLLYKDESYQITITVIAKKITCQ